MTRWRVAAVVGLIASLIVASCGTEEVSHQGEGISNHTVAELCNAPLSFFSGEWGVQGPVEQGVNPQDSESAIGRGTSCRYSGPNGFKAHLMLFTDSGQPAGDEPESPLPGASRQLAVGADTVEISGLDTYPFFSTTVEGWDVMLSISVPVPPGGRLIERQPPNAAQVDAAAAFLVRTTRELTGT